jgi:NitT/TauT family transport system permease protein/taurine transport system permease protein
MSPSSRPELGMRRAVQEWWLLAAVLTVWAAASALGWVPRAVFPDLQTLFRTARELAFGDAGILGSLGDHVVASVLRFAMGYSLSIVVGLAVGLLMAASSTASALMLPVLRFLYPIPGLAWTPLVIMWCGIGENAVVTLIFLSAVWPILYGAYDGFRNVPAPYLRVARQLEASWPVRVRKVLIPAALPILLSAMRISHGVGWRAIIGAEMIAALSGLGYMLNMGGELRRPDVVVVGMVVIAIISVIFDRTIFDVAERRLIGKRSR